MGDLMARLAWCERMLMQCFRRIAALEAEVRSLRQAKQEIRSVSG